VKIGHVSYFGVNRSGLYEASRDMAKSDIIAGNQVFFFDAGVPEKDGRKTIQVGAVDNRSGFKLETANPDLLNEMDLIFMHTGIDDKYLVKTNAPIIWVVHGKPLDCFRPEQDGIRDSYTLYNNLAKWKRSIYMLYFWKEYIPFWCNFPKEKKLILDYPVIDQYRFNDSDDMYQIEDKGKYNVLICDSDRADIDKFEMIIGAIETAKKIKGIKFHFIGLDFPLKNCFKTLLDELDKVGGLGDLKPRMGDMQKFYRAMDITFSPNRIINRVVAESLCCGTPVIQELNIHNMSDYSCYIPNPQSVVDSFIKFVNDFDNKKIKKDSIIERSKVFNIENYNKIMDPIYKKIISW